MTTIAISLIVGMAWGCYAGKRRERGMGWGSIIVEFAKATAETAVAVWNWVARPFSKGKKPDAENSPEDSAEKSGADGESGQL